MNAMTEITAIQTTVAKPTQKKKGLRRPTHPGKFLLHEILRPNKLSITDAANRLGLPRKDLNLFVVGKRRCTAKIAKKLSSGTGTSVDFWLNMQKNIDVWLANKISDGDVKPLF